MNTSATTLTDRYVAAAMRTVPEQQRADLATELRASIDDQIDARVDQGEPRESAERAVLTDLGDPDKLAAGYTDRPLWLIGPRYYLDVVAPHQAAAGDRARVRGLRRRTRPDAGRRAVRRDRRHRVSAVTISVVVHIAFWTTLVFAIVERSAKSAGAGFADEWTLDQLPEPKDRGASLSDLIASLVFLAVAAGAILWDQLHRLRLHPGGGSVSFLDPELWPWWIACAVRPDGARGPARDLRLREGALGHRLRDGQPVPQPRRGRRCAVAARTAGADQPRVLPIGHARRTRRSRVYAVITVLSGFGIVAIAGWDIIDAFLKARRAR